MCSTNSTSWLHPRGLRLLSTPSTPQPDNANACELRMCKSPTRSCHWSWKAWGLVGELLKGRNGRLTHISGAIRSYIYINRKHTRTLTLNKLFKPSQTNNLHISRDYSQLYANVCLCEGLTQDPCPCRCTFQQQTRSKFQSILHRCSMMFHK